MHEATRRALNTLNRRFYDARGPAFDASRDHPWPGWLRVIEGIAPGDSTSAVYRVLDVGCGNGRFAAALAASTHTADATRKTRYLGIDSSAPLLESARVALQSLPAGFETELHALDFLADPGPDALARGPFDLVVAFGVLHHVPSEALRRKLFEALAERVAPGGRLVVTAWQFAGRERFAKSIFPVSVIESRAPEWGFDPDDLEPGDHLLGFGGDASVPRYCHHLDAAELDRLARDLGLELTEEFEADGKSRDLNLYRVYTKQRA